MPLHLSLNVEIIDDITEGDAGLADGHVTHKNNFHLRKRMRVKCWISARLDAVSHLF